MSCSMSIEQKLCEVKIFWLQSMLNAIRCIDQRFEIKNSCISCLALIFNLKNYTNIPLCKKFLYAKIGCRWRNTTSHIPFFFELLIRTNGLVVKTGCRESGDMGSIPKECWNPLQCLCWHWASQCTDMCYFYITVLSIMYFFLDFVSGDLALTEL